MSKKQFEYMIYKPDIKGFVFKNWDKMGNIENELNDMGKDGWEIMCVFPIQTGHRGIFSDSGETSGFIAFLKREIISKK